MVSSHGSYGSKKEKPLAQGRLNETNALSSYLAKGSLRIGFDFLYLNSS